jgi:hypothetical protein
MTTHAYTAATHPLPRRISTTSEDANVHIQSYYAQALTSGRRDRTGGLSAQTVRHHDRVLNVAF